ncbi:MAG: four helix bundle protein [Bacteroidia bacterium]|nr:MAG: four helix bundle protein [Bacteroidia bacterium]
MTKRYNVNRGYMKLDVWKESVELFHEVYVALKQIPDLDFRLRSQINDAIQSVSANIAEGYCRRTINEYLQYLNIALGSLGEGLTRLIGLTSVNLLSQEVFEIIDKKHYSVENKLVALVRSLQAKRRERTWEEEFRS